MVGWIYRIRAGHSIENGTPQSTAPGAHRLAKGQSRPAVDDEHVAAITPGKVIQANIRFHLPEIGITGLGNGVSGERKFCEACTIPGR
jgi:hypothetical protein